MDGSDPVRADAAARPVELREERRRATSSRMATGTFACGRCDAPVAPGENALSPADDVRCPYCGHVGAVRDFLSLTAPSRPARVQVRVVRRSRRALR
jgi:DNA-directed RNA polymerase subunit RPC12/RpoP